MQVYDTQRLTRFTCRHLVASNFMKQLIVNKLGLPPAAHSPAVPRYMR